MKNKILILLISVLANFATAKALTRAELSFLAAHLQKQNTYMKILMKKGPAAYIEAAALKLSREDKKAMIADLMILQKTGILTQYELDQKNEVVIVRHGATQSTLRADH